MPNGFVGFCVRFAYTVDTNERYAKIKGFFQNLTTNDKFMPKRIADAVMIFLVVSTVVIYLYSINHKEPFELVLFEYFAITVFTLEYLVRLWTSSDTHKIVINDYEESVEMQIDFSLWKVFRHIAYDKFAFIIKPMSMVDLASIHPELRPLRLFKIFRYSDSTRQLLSIVEHKKYELSVLAVLIFMTIFIASALFYVFEIKNTHIHSFFDSIYWAVVTIATVGYGDIVPTTVEGKVTSIFLVFSGLGVIAMLTSIFTSAFQQRITIVRDKKDFELIGSLEDFVVIAGFGTMGQDVAHRLQAAKIHFLVMDTSNEKINLAKELGYKSYLADASNIDALNAIGFKTKARALLCLTISDMTNVSIILAARSISPTVEIIAKANDIKNESKLLLAKANHVISHKMGAQILAEFINKPIAYEAISQLVVDDKRILADEIEVPVLKWGKSAIKIESLEIEKFDCLLLGVMSNSDKIKKFHFNQETKDMLLRHGDILIVIGKPKRIEGLRLKLLNEANIRG